MRTLQRARVGDAMTLHHDPRAAIVGIDVHHQRRVRRDPPKARGSHPHWYLPPLWASRFRAALGGVIDLDPCAARPDLDAIHADTAYLYPYQDGLALPWFGRVYCNPPYDRNGVRAFASKAIREVDNCQSMALLAPCAPSSRWWRDLARAAEVVIFLPVRINFIDGSPNPGKTTSGKQALTIFGWRLQNVDAFEGIPVRDLMSRANFREKPQQEKLNV